MLLSANRRAIDSDFRELGPGLSAEHVAEIEALVEEVAPPDITPVRRAVAVKSAKQGTVRRFKSIRSDEMKLTERVSGYTHRFSVHTFRNFLANRLKGDAAARYNDRADLTTIVPEGTKNTQGKFWQEEFILPAQAPVTHCNFLGVVRAGAHYPSPL